MFFSFHAAGKPSSKRMLNCCPFWPALPKALVGSPAISELALLHWMNRIGVLSVPLCSDDVKPRDTKATVCCGLFKGSRVGGDTEMLATICVGTRVELTP